MILVQLYTRKKEARYLEIENLKNKLVRHITPILLHAPRIFTLESFFSSRMHATKQTSTHLALGRDFAPRIYVRVRWARPMRYYSRARYAVLFLCCISSHREPSGAFEK